MGVGNGLTSTTLVVFLALELDAPNLGLGISLILAMPNLVGLLRLATPVLIGRIADRKTFCLGTFILSGLLLFCLPLVCRSKHCSIGRNVAGRIGDPLVVASPDAIPGHNRPVFLAGRHCPAADPRPLFWVSPALAGCRRSYRRVGVRIVLILVDKHVQSISTHELDRLCNSRRAGQHGS